MRPEVRQGWDVDPFGLHERRYFSAGEPTNLVSDGGVESYDPPPPTADAATATPTPTTVVAGPMGPSDADAAEPSDPGPGGPAAGAASGDPGPPPRRRRRVLAAVGATVVVVAGVTTGLAVSGGGNPTHASATVISSTAATMDQGSAHVSLALHGTAAGTAIQMSGQGDADFSHQMATFTLNVNAASQSQSLQLVQDGQTLYLSTPQIAQLIPGKSWVSISESQTGSPDAGSLSPVVGAGNPSDILKQLTAAGATVTDTGPSAIDGVAVEEYHVIPPTLPNGSPAADALHQLSMNFDVYIDGANLLRRVHFTLSGTVASQAIDIDGTVDLSQYGTPVTVTPPPADQVLPFSQILGPTGALGTKGSFQL